MPEVRGWRVSATVALVAVALGGCGASTTKTVIAGTPHPNPGSVLYVAVDRDLLSYNPADGALRGRTKNVTTTGIRWMAAGATGLWIVDQNDIKLVDPHSDQVTGSISVDRFGDVKAITVDRRGNAWVCDHQVGLMHFVPGHTAAELVDLGGRCQAIVVAPDGVVWAASDVGGGEIVSIDATTLQVSRPLADKKINGDILAVSNQYLIVSCTCDSPIVRIDRTTLADEPLGRGGALAGIGTPDNAVWFLVDGGLRRMDIMTGDFGNDGIAVEPESKARHTMTVGDGYFWLAGKQLLRLDPFLYELQPVADAPDQYTSLANRPIAYWIATSKAAP